MKNNQVSNLKEGFDYSKLNEHTGIIKENSTVDEIKDTSSHDNSKLVDDDTKDEDVDESIESVPFISEPVKKKRTRSQK